MKELWWASEWMQDGWRSTSFIFDKWMCVCFALTLPVDGWMVYMLGVVMVRDTKREKKEKKEEALPFVAFKTNLVQRECQSVIQWCLSHHYLRALCFRPFTIHGSHTLRQYRQCQDETFRPRDNCQIC